MHSHRDALPKVKGCISTPPPLPRPRDAFPRGIPKAEGCLFQAGPCIPPGMLSQSQRCSPQELCLPTTAAPAANSVVRVRLAARSPPERCHRAVGQGGELRVPRVVPFPCLLPALPCRCCPAPQHPLGCPPAHAHPLGCSSALWRVVSCPLRPCPRPHPCPDLLHQQTAPGDPALGLRRLHQRCHEWVTAPPAPGPRVQALRGWGGTGGGRLGCRDGKQEVELVWEGLCLSPAVPYLCDQGNTTPLSVCLSVRMPLPVHPH